MCENAKAINRDRTSYSFKTVLGAHIAGDFFKSNSRISFSSRFELLSIHTAWAHRVISLQKQRVGQFQIKADIR